jgi:integrase
MRLTRQTVSRLELPEGKSDAIFFDDALAGFGVRIRAGGKRTWIVQYRVDGKTHRESLGAVGTVNPDEARDYARKVLAGVQLGADPKAEKAQKAAEKARAALTFGAVAERYLTRSAARLRPRSHAEVKRHLTWHWAPLWELPMHSVTRRDVSARLTEIATSRGPFAANRARSTLSAMFSWAMREGQLDIEVNPVANTNRMEGEKSRERVLTEPEIAAIWHACGADDYGRIVRLLLLTGQRREEVGAMRWSELDLTPGNAVWRLPASRTKNNKPHDVPLPDEALEILQSAPRRAVPGTNGAEERDLVFGQHETPFRNWSRAKIAMDKRIAKNAPASLKMPMSPWRIHDLRRTVITGMNEIGIAPHVVEAVVNHLSGAAKSGVAGIYNRAAYSVEKRQALNSWTEHVRRKAHELMWQ